MLFRCYFLVCLFLLKWGKKNLKRFGEIKRFPNVIEYPENIAGNWKKYFKNNNAIILELACGKGEYTVGLAN